MKLLPYEYKKLIATRFIPILLVVLFAANLIVCASLEEHSPRDRRYDGVLSEILALKSRDPDEYARVVSAVNEGAEKQRAAYTAARMQAFEEGKTDVFIDPDDPSFAEHSYSGIISDRLLLELLSPFEISTESFEDEVGTILTVSKENAKELREQYRLGVDDYAYYKQLYTYRIYEEMKNGTTVGEDHIYGWEQFFSYSYGDFFLFFGLLLIAGGIFLFDRSVGFSPILRTTKRGRLRTCFSKIGLLALLTAISVLLFEGAAILVLLFRTGFSGLSAPVQNIPSLRLFPQRMTIGGYLVYFLASKLFFALCFSMICAFLASLCRAVIPAFLSCGGFLALNVYLSTLDRGVHPLLSRLNFISAQAVVPLSERLLFVEAFGMPVRYRAVALIAGSLFAVLSVCGVCLLFAFRREASGRVSFKLSQLWASIKKLPGKWGKRAAPKRRKGEVYARPVYIWELSKLLFGSIPGCILLATLLLYPLVTGAVRAAVFKPTEKQLIYELLYLPEIYGDYRENKENVESVIAYYTNTEESVSITEEKFSSGQITKEERDRTVEYLYDVRGKTAEAAADLRALRDSFNKHSANGVDVQFIDHFGWTKLFSQNTSWPLYLALLLIGTFSFALEYAGKGKQDRFLSLLRSTRNGRGKTFFAKYAAVVLTALLFTVAFLTCKAVFLSTSYSFENASAPIQSLPMFSEMNAQLSIVGYLVLSCAAQLFSACLAAAFFVSVFALSENLFLGLSLSLLPLIPSALSALGMKNAGYVSFTDWLSFDRMALLSCKTDLFGTDFGLFALFAVLVVALTVVLLLIARRKFVK